MTIEIEKRYTLLLVRVGKGLYRQLLFADMSEQRARLLACEYGYRQEDIGLVRHEALRYRRQLDDELVRSILERMPYHERNSHEAMLAAVRRIVPQATRIVGK
ncbi:MAG: hypothetical protein IJK84_02040 [Bacteroidales bacterium]|nr:hypothetical protein [Bacteroidales bacterium]